MGQLPAGVPEHPPLNLQIPGPASLPAQKAEQAVHRRQHGVHRGRRTSAGEKLLLPGADRLAVHRPVPQPQGKSIDVSLIFCNGAGAALLPLQVLGKFGQILTAQFVFVHDKPPNLAESFYSTPQKRKTRKPSPSTDILPTEDKGSDNTKPLVKGRLFSVYSMSVRNVSFSGLFSSVPQTLSSRFLFLGQYSGNHHSHQPIPASHRLTAASRSFSPTTPAGENSPLIQPSRRYKTLPHLAATLLSWVTIRMVVPS